MDALEALERDENYLSSDISSKLAFGEKRVIAQLTEREKKFSYYWRRDYNQSKLLIA